MLAGRGDDTGVPWEVALYEGRNVVELRYAGGVQTSGVPVPPRAYPMIHARHAAVGAYAVPTVAGTSVRFTPR